MRGRKRREQPPPLEDAESNESIIVREDIDELSNGPVKIDWRGSSKSPGRSPRRSQPKRQKREEASSESRAKRTPAKKCPPGSRLSNGKCDEVISSETRPSACAVEEKSLRRGRRTSQKLHVKLSSKKTVEVKKDNDGEFEVKAKQQGKKRSVSRKKRTNDPTEVEASNRVSGILKYFARKSNDSSPRLSPSGGKSIYPAPSGESVAVVAVFDIPKRSVNNVAPSPKPQRSPRAKTPKKAKTEEKEVVEVDVPVTEGSPGRTPLKTMKASDEQILLVDELETPPKLSLNRRRPRSRIVIQESTPTSPPASNPKLEHPGSANKSPHQSESDSNRRRSIRLAARAALCLAESPPAKSPRCAKPAAKTKKEPDAPPKFVKIAPLFLPKAKKQKVEKEVKPLWTEEQLAARRRFLSSGLPEEVVKIAAKASEKAYVREACFPSSENCHVTQSSLPPFNIEQLAEAVKNSFRNHESYNLPAPSWTPLAIKPAETDKKSNRCVPNGIVEVDLESSSESSSVPLWTDRPITELLGEQEAWSKISAWLEEWRKSEKALLKPSKRKQRAFDSSDEDDDGDEKRPSLLVICGPTGVGKTSAVHHLAKQTGFSVLEVNCSSRRSGKLVLTQLREATQSHQLQKGKSEAATSGCVILLDDVDVVFEGEDDGFVNAVGVFASETKRPIVVTTTSPTFARFDGNFDFVFVDVSPVSSTTLAAHLKRFIEEDGFEMSGPDDSSLLELAEYCKGDVRRALNELQGFISSLPGKSVPQNILRCMLMGDRELKLDCEFEPPVLGMLHRNICRFLRTDGRKLVEKPEENAEKRDFWMFVEAEVVDFANRPADLQLNTSIFSTSDDEDNYDPLGRIGDVEREETGANAANGMESPCPEENGPVEPTVRGFRRSSDRQKSRMLSLSKYCDSVASQDAFSRCAGLLETETGWPPWNGGSLDHGLSDDWSALPADANAAAVSSSIAAYLESGEVSSVCSSVGKHIERVDNVGEMAGDDGAGDGAIFAFFAPLTYETKPLLRVWDKSVEERRHEATIQSTYAKLIDLIPRHRALNRANFVADFMPGFRQIVRSDVFAGKARAAGRQRRHALSSGSMTPHLHKAELVLDDPLVRRLCCDFFE